MVIEIRWHGRGGQGAVTAAEILASAAALEGKWVQAFPSFGAERRGAPVQAYTRIDEKPILDRSFIYEPDIVVVLDEGLLDAERDSVLMGLKLNGKLVVNSGREPKALAKMLEFNGDVATVDATSIAIEVLGAPIVNTAILGAVARVVDLVKKESIVEVMREKFPPTIAEKNIKAFTIAYYRTVVGRL
ncbi:MAG: 2-oxoacid:acceptor oxidoreductase family protein [Candidatus Nezhaarchaeales archaeon]